MGYILKWGTLGCFLWLTTGCDLFFPSKDKEDLKQQSYNISYPPEDVSLPADTTVAIQWVSEISDPYVNIQLYRGDTLVQDIATQVENSGSYPWRVSSPDSGTYRIRIVSYSDSTLADFSADFQIASYYGGYLVHAPDEGFKTEWNGSLIISWESFGRPGSLVDIWLYKDTLAVANIIRSTVDDGAHAWTHITSSQGAGEDYRIKIISASDSSIGGFSDYFTIQSVDPVPYRGSFTITNPDSTDTLEVGKTYDITWTVTETPADSVRLELHKDTSLVFLITTATAEDGSYSWTLPSGYPSSSSYRIKIASLQNSDLTAFSEPFTIQSVDQVPYRGSFTITNPDSADTFGVGKTYDITWTITEKPADSVRLELYKDTSLVFLIAASTVEDGNYSWTLPPNYPSSSNYRIKITSLQNPGISALSQPFTILGVEPDDYVPDNYEPDNDSASATSLTLGLPQAHTINGNDSDWYAVQVDSGMTYIVNTTGTKVYTLIYQPGSKFYDEYFSTQGPNLWTPGSTGLYYVLVHSDSGHQGPYTFSIFSLDSIEVMFTHPDASTIVQVGQSLPLQWDTATSTLLGSSVNLTLMQGSEPAMPIASGTGNDGEYFYTVPAGFSSGDNFRIRMQSSDNTDMTAYSDFFSITGVAPDAFEEDDSLESAKTISKDGEFQNRTLSYQDEDWVRFNAEKGAVYVINIKGNTPVNISVTDSVGSQLQTFYGSNTTQTSPPMESGTHYLRVFQTETSYGDYSLSLFEIGADSVDIPFLVIDPDSGAVWEAGTTYSINWTSSTLLGSHVNLVLFKGSTQLQIITTGTSNDGMYYWRFPSGLMTGNDYYIRITNYNLPEIHGRSHPFTINGLVADPLEPDNIRDSAAAVTPDGTVYSRSLPDSDQDWMTFNAEAGNHYMAVMTGGLRATLSVYEGNSGNTLSSTISTNPILALQNAKADSYVWRVSGSASGNYQIRFEPFQPDSLVTFTNPVSNSVLSAASSYSITWEPDTTFIKSNVALHLYKGEHQVLSVGSATMLSGQRTWNIPAGLATGSDYTLRMTALSLSNLYTHSPAFTISGIAPDSFEPNDSVFQAAPIVTDGSTQNLNLTYQDKDWFHFTTSANYIYRITTSQEAILRPSMVLYSDSGSTQLASTTTADTTHSLIWAAGESQEVQLKISAFSRTGEYSLNVQGFDPSDHEFTVTEPEERDAFAGGDSLNIAWTSEINLGGNVDIFLFNEEGVVQTIMANTPNTGFYSWMVPASLTAGADYYIRIISRISSDINGNSELFTIN